MSLRILVTISAICCCQGCLSQPNVSQQPCPNSITGEALLRTFILPINFDDPKGDLSIRVNHGDLRLLCIREIALAYPGLSITDRGIFDHIEAFGCREVEGSGDGLDNFDHAGLLEKMGDYSLTYNLGLMSYLRNVCSLDE